MLVIYVIIFVEIKFHVTYYLQFHKKLFVKAKHSNSEINILFQAFFRRNNSSLELVDLPSSRTRKFRVQFDRLVWNPERNRCNICFIRQNMVDHFVKCDTFDRDFHVQFASKEEVERDFVSKYYGCTIYGEPWENEYE